MMNQYHLNEAQEMEMLQRMAKEAIEIGIHEPAETLSMYMMNRGILMNQYHLNEAQKMEMFQGMAKYAIESGIHEPVKDPKQDGTMDSGSPRKTTMGSGVLTSTVKSRRSKIGGMKLVDARSSTANELMGPSKPTKQNLKPQGPCLWGKMAKSHTNDTHILLNGHDMLSGTVGGKISKTPVLPGIRKTERGGEPEFMSAPLEMEEEGEFYDQQLSQKVFKTYCYTIFII